MKMINKFGCGLSALILCFSMGICNAHAGETIPTENAESVFKTLPRDYVFSSGAGGWSTGMDIADDGTFTGSFHDSEMGSTGPGYPHGTVYSCNSNGKFSEPQVVDEHTLRMELEYLEIDHTPGDEKIEDQIRYIYSDPYGLDNADEFFIYLPGAEIAALPEGFLNWAKMWLNSRTNGTATTLPSGFYGIYNVGGEQGFVHAWEDSTVDETEAVSGEYIIADSDIRYLTESELSGLS